MAVAVTGVSLNKTELNLDISSTETLVATVQPEDATDKSVTWSTSDSNIATVTDGIVTPKGNGSCDITVTTTDGEFTASCLVNITTKITGITLNKSNLTLEKQDSEKLVASLIPESATPELITWSSSNTNVATVDQDGNITGISSGTCNIIASVSTFSATCIVKIIVLPTSISLNINRIDQHILDETEPETLIVSFEPEDCTEKDITWISTNRDIVETTTGLLNYNGDYGTCYIMATDVVGNSAECIVNVYKRQPKPNPPVVANIDKYSVVLEELKNGIYTNNNGLNWNYGNAFNDLEFNSEYIFKQKYKSDGYLLESEISDGITVKTKDITHVESVSLDKHEVIINLGDKNIDTVQFICEIEPDDAEIKGLYWSTDNNYIATADSDGTLSALHAGETTLTVTSVDGAKTDTCLIKVYKNWEQPQPPIITNVTTNSVTLEAGENILYSIDNGSNWQSSNIFENLKPKTLYNIICKKKASGYNTDSKISGVTSFITLEKDPDPDQKIININSVTLAAHNLYFNLKNNTYATLNYTINPNNATNKTVMWYSNDNNIVKVDATGSITAVGPGHGIVYIRTIDSNKSDFCNCYVYNPAQKPETPTLKEVKMNSVELNPVENCEYSMDKENWQDSTLFSGLEKETFYTFYQRVKAVGDYQPPSEISNGLTVKTDTDHKHEGTSPSGYEWGQKVEVHNIPVYPSPYAKFSNLRLTGTYYIFNIYETNNRIKICELEDYVGIAGHSTGWVYIADLKFIVDQLYIGDKVIVSGDINMNADGSGNSIHKEKEEMYITDIIEGFEYGYGVTTKPGLVRQGFAKRDQITKYKIIKRS